MGDKGTVTLTVEGDDLIVSSVALKTDRVARIYFLSILGGRESDGGWRCPRRRESINTFVVRVNTFLESKGWIVDRVGIVDEAVRREVERKRSFARTRDAATSFRAGVSQLDPLQIRQHLGSTGWSEENRPLREHQTIGLLHGLTAINFANFSVPGSGKTATTLAVASSHTAAETIDVVLVVGPLSSFRPWEREIQAATPELFKARRIRGSASQRKAAYESISPRQVVLISYATAAADRLQLIGVCQRYRVMLVVDESHRIKRFKGGTWAPALLDIARGARVRCILSGTPMPQSGKDLYSQLNIIWPSGELTGPRDTFAARVEKQFDSILRDVQPFIFRTPKTALGLPPLRVAVHDVPLTGTQAEIYEVIESGFKKKLADAENWKDKIDALRRAKPIRLLQAAANPDVLNSADSYYGLPRIEAPNPTLMQRLAGYGSKERPAKSLAAMQLIKEIASRGEKVVCWSNFIRNLDQFSRMTTAELGIRCYQIDGRVPTGDETQNDNPAVPRMNPDDTDTREKLIDQFLNIPGPSILVANPASCSESISLHSTCRNAVYLDRTYDCSLFLQSLDRIHRLGLPDDANVQIHILLATLEGRPTIDGLVHSALLRKEASMKQLLEGAQLRPFNLTDDPLESAQGDDQDLTELLRFLLGENA